MRRRCPSESPGGVGAGLASRANKVRRLRWNSPGETWMSTTRMRWSGAAILSALAFTSTALAGGHGSRGGACPSCLYPICPPASFGPPMVHAGAPYGYYATNWSRPWAQAAPVPPPRVEENHTPPPAVSESPIAPPMPPPPEAEPLPAPRPIMENGKTPIGGPQLPPLLPADLR